MMGGTLMDLANPQRRQMSEVFDSLVLTDDIHAYMHTYSRYICMYTTSLGHRSNIQLTFGPHCSLLQHWTRPQWSHLAPLANAPPSLSHLRIEILPLSLLAASCPTSGPPALSNAKGNPGRRVDVGSHGDRDWSTGVQTRPKEH
jgi:hypothetical protein